MNIIRIIRKFLNDEIITILIFIICALGLNIYRIQGDGEAYYALLEKTLNVDNPESPSSQLTREGFFQNGSIFFNVPFYLGAYAIERAFTNKPNFNGITLRSASINIASNFYMIMAIILIFKILKMLNLKYGLVSTLSILFSTSAFTVSVVMPSYSHAVDIFVTTLFIYLILKCSQEDSRELFWLGALYPIAITIRYFNFILIIPLIIKLLLGKEYKKCMTILLGILSTAWILPLLFTYYNRGVDFQGGPLTRDNLRSLARLPCFPKYALKLLVHPIHGLFIWSPVTILSALGFIKMTDEKKKANGYMLLSVWILLVIAYGFLSEWHAGWSFSNRYLVSLFPVYTIGLAYFLEKYGKWSIVVSIAATLYSVFLFFNWYICVFHGQWETPLDMVEYWLNGESYYFSGKKVNLSIFLQRVLQLCRYKHIIRFVR